VCVCVCVCVCVLAVYVFSQTVTPHCKIFFLSFCDYIWVSVLLQTLMSPLQINLDPLQIEQISIERIWVNLLLMSAFYNF
jgi:hypothetical protein